MEQPGEFHKAQRGVIVRELRFVGVTTAALLALGAGSASAADGGLDGQNEDSLVQDSERYRNFDLQELGGPLLARVVVDLKDRDFTVCDKKANGYWAYASFQETVSSPPAKPLLPGHEFRSEVHPLRQDDLEEEGHRHDLPVRLAVGHLHRPRRPVVVTVHRSGPRRESHFGDT
ncbi:hypothetical protein ACXIZN_09170 [Amycolatopsis sp. TRM77291]